MIALLAPNRQKHLYQIFQWGTKHSSFFIRKLNNFYIISNKWSNCVLFYLANESTQTLSVFQVAYYVGRPM